MKRTEFKKHAAALLLMLCLLAVSALPAFATSANIKLTDRNGDPMTGTIRVRLYDEASQKALRGGELTIYRVAEVQRKNGDLSFEYCGDFYGCGIELGDLNDLGDSSLAGRLLDYLAPGSEGTVQAVDNDGNAVFEDLELGLYLVAQTKASAGYKAVNPFLVSLPLAEDGQWLYDVDASPKVGAYTPETPETPDTPSTPVSPDSPSTPATPDSPDAPNEPSTPADTDTPAQPGRPANPDLPKTGQLNWPVPVMAVSGLLLFAFGWTLDRRCRMV